MTDRASGVGDLTCIPLKVSTQIGTTGKADALVAKVPFDCRIVSAECGSETVAGTPTTVTMMLENGTTDIFSAEADIKTPTSPVTASVLAAQEKLTKGDVLHLDITISGGSTPLVDGAYCNLFVVRE